MEYLLTPELPSLALVVMAFVYIIERVIGAFVTRVKSREAFMASLAEQLADHDEISIVIRRRKRE